MTCKYIRWKNGEFGFQNTNNMLHNQISQFATALKLPYYSQYSLHCYDIITDDMPPKMGYSKLFAGSVCTRQFSVRQFTGNHAARPAFMNMFRALYKDIKARVFRYNNRHFQRNVRTCGARFIEMAEPEL